MDGEIEVKSSELDSVVQFRNGVTSFEKMVGSIGGSFIGDSDNCPLKHTFAPGVYVREIFIPKGTVVVGKIHKHSHPNFLMSGEVVVVTESGGRENLKAPMSMISKAGTKRIVFAVEDTVWITVHATDEVDLLKIEDHVIAKSYEEFNEFIKLTNEKVLNLEDK